MLLDLYGLLWANQVEKPTTPQPYRSGAGSGGDAGTGFIKKEHGWVKAIKYRRSGVSFGLGRTFSHASATGVLQRCAGRFNAGSASVRTGAEGVRNGFDVFHPEGSGLGSNAAQCAPARSASYVSGAASVGTVGGDELLILLEYIK